MQVGSVWGRPLSLRTESGDSSVMGAGIGQRKMKLGPHPCQTHKMNSTANSLKYKN